MPVKLATAVLASIALMIAPFAMAVAFPTEVTGPVRFAFVATVLAVVAVAALPVILPAIGLVTVKPVKVPTLVKLDPVTVDFKVVPVNCSAAAAAPIVISKLPSNATPLIFFVAASFVAVAALPKILV